MIITTVAESKFQPTEAQLRALLLAWSAVFGVDAVKAVDVTRRLAGGRPDCKTAAVCALREAIRAVAGVPLTRETTWKPCDARRLGHVLRAIAGREAAGLAVWPAIADRHSHVRRWRVCARATNDELTKTAPARAPRPQYLTPPRRQRRKSPKPALAPTPTRERFVQPCIRAEPPGGRLLAAVALRDSLGRGTVVRVGSRHAVDLPVRNPGTADRAVRQLERDHVGVRFTITDTFDAEAVDVPVAPTPPPPVAPSLIRWGNPSDRAEWELERRRRMRWDPYRA